MSNLIDLYNEILTFNNKQVIMIIDNKNNPWFLGKHVAKLLEYKDTGDTIRRKVSSKYKKNYGDLKNYSKYDYPISIQSLFINEPGLYELLRSSRMELAEKFNQWINEKVIPQIRKEGKYEINKPIKDQLKELTNKIIDQKRKIMILENNNKKPIYPKGGYIYAIQPPTKNNEKVYKIGKTNDLKNRMKVYNTGYPDNVISIFNMKVDNPERVEKCIKVYLDDYQYRNRKEFYKIKKSKLIYIMENCVKTLTNKTFERKMKRHLNNNENFDDNEKEEIFGILAVPYDYNIDQEGGGNSQYNKIVNSFNKTKELYDSIKKMSSIVNRFAKFDKIQ